MAIRTTLTRGVNPGSYILRIQNYRTNRFFPLRYVKVGNHRIQRIDALASQALSQDLELTLLETYLIDQCGGRANNCQLDVSLSEKFIDHAVIVGKVTVPFDS